MGHGGTGETSQGPQRSTNSKSIKERSKSTNSKKRANGKERGRRAVSISSSSEPAGIEEGASGIRVIGCSEKSNKRKRSHPSIEGGTAEPKPK